MIYKNGEGYHDRTAGEAIKEADRPPEKVTRAVTLIKYIADWCGLEITHRVWLRDKETGREYR